MLEKRKTQNQTITLQKYQPVFTTVDDKVHEGLPCKWINQKYLACSPQNFFMKEITSLGYLEDCEKTIYPIQNILCITWNLIDVKQLLINKNEGIQITYTDEEVSWLENNSNLLKDNQDFERD